MFAFACSLRVWLLARLHRLLLLVRFTYSLPFPFLSFIKCDIQYRQIKVDGSFGGDGQIIDDVLPK